jgi:hypothetical protein
LQQLKAEYTVEAKSPTFSQKVKQFVVKTRENDGTTPRLTCRLGEQQRNEDNRQENVQVQFFQRDWNVALRQNPACSMKKERHIERLGPPPRKKPRLRETKRVNLDAVLGSFE